jgi:DNA-binding transcriptional ArsR family regulator|tara:strand:+ start:3075 stop:3530 length:456 start_codon:yes stop_codon:yes gene_type:complete
MPRLKYVSDEVRVWLAENAQKYSDSLVTRCGIVFDIDRRTAYYHLRRLIDNGAIRTEGSGRWMRYELVDMSKVDIDRKIKSKKVRNTETSDQLISLMNVNDLSVSDVSRLTGFNERSVYVWLKPPDDKLWVPAHVCAVRLLQAYSEMGKLK